MARLPDRFDLWVRKARECTDPARQIDYVLGAMAALTDWHFFNVGTKDVPQPAEAEIEDGRYLLVFSDVDRIEEIVEERGAKIDHPPVISIPVAAAMTWCIERKAQDCAGLLVNPGDFAVVIPLGHLEIFHDEWMQRRGKQTSGFWIPNGTSEEEEFWQQFGI